MSLLLIYTSVNQCLRRGPVTIGEPSSTKASEGPIDYVLSGGWAHHDRVGEVMYAC